MPPPSTTGPPLNDRTKLLGFGIPVNTLPDDHFPVAYHDWQQIWPHTNRERCMVAFMEEVTLKKDWPSEVFDDMAVAKLKADILARDCEKSFKITHGDFTETMFQYCITELREKAELYQETCIVPVLDIESLQEAAKILESTNAHIQNSTPGTKDTAVNIIDPSLYALSYGRSKALPDEEINLQNCLKYIGKGHLVPKPPRSSRIAEVDIDEPPAMVYSLKSQWLPCNVQFPDGINAKITSHVNNLHPRDHADVYSLLEKVITKTMPIWNLVYSTVYESTIPCSMRIYCSEAGRTFPNGETPPWDPLGLKDDLYNGVIDDNEWQRRTDEWLHAQTIIDRPEPELKPRPEDRHDGWEDRCQVTSEAIADRRTLLGGSDGIQVIIKLSAWYLTPENPICNTENEWALDGVPNDHICATAVYIFDDHNVTDTKISFRSRFQGLCFEEDCQVEPGDTRAVEEIFGFTHRDPSIQEIGSVTMREGLLLAYPNILQHMGSSTQLKDPTKPGHRKILTLYLVDPRVKVLSTANVPPQQADWWAREFSDEAGQFNGLPKEVVDMVLDEVIGCPFSKKEAGRLKDVAARDRICASKQITKVLTSYRVDLGVFSEFGDSETESNIEETGFPSDDESD
ncbi:DUF1665 domain containing protein [Colletotrichum tofieldiae]|nr:DUF1665 domain containing protein [Colletotrichum tofieldiae]